MDDLVREDEARIKKRKSGSQYSKDVLMINEPFLFFVSTSPSVNKVQLVWSAGYKAWVTRLVVEGKEPLSEDGLYQVLKYACKEGLANLSKGCVEPIHVMQWSAFHWKYGVLDVYA
ncbi:hypothetical protein SELMODRAFT_424098 [Selaginella moellendorffii]|uniref:Uncharacterized protein n=1 Tax=Selaginella moellendorffii TaxID=88036 RepID=D8SNT3_SELML|nr:hypothetical protein SELMODRAFT_424098 [Selaginella moellendorffii]